MKKLYLITGFLGAGKTTFLTEIAKAYENERIAIIVNEFGAVGVDSDKLKTQGIESYEITNGSIFCVCRKDLFMEALEMANKLEVSTIFVETSGLSDPLTSDEILEQMKELYNVEFDYRGVVSLIDAKNFIKVLNTAVCVKNQVISADLFVLNKCDLATDIMTVKKELMMLNATAPIIETTYAKIDTKLFTELEHTRKTGGEHKKDIILQKKLIEFEETLSVQKLRDWLASFGDRAYRIKGFVHTEDGDYNVEFVMGDTIFTECSYGGDKSFLVVLYNSKMLNFNEISPYKN